MEDMIIADSSVAFVMGLQAKLAQTTTIRSCHNASDLMTMIKVKMPDFLILDLSLPGCDGIELLRTITAMPNAPAVLVNVDYLSDYVRCELAAMGIGFLMVRPCDMELIANRVREMLCYYADHSTQEDLLCKLGISGKLSGAVYIRCALPYLMKNPDLQLTKELYPMIAAKFGKNAQSVERSIRNAVHVTWKKHGASHWLPYLDKEAGRPSNSQFFQMLLNMIRKVG